MIYPENFESKIGFDRIREMLTEGCLSELGRQHVTDMAFMQQFDELRHELGITEEMRKILLFEENFPEDNYIDSTGILKKIRVVGTFPEVADLNDLRKSLLTIQSLVRFFLGDETQQKYPGISEQAKLVKLFPLVSQRIDAIISAQGIIKDSASSELREIRSQQKEKQSSIARKMQSILKAARQDGLVDDDAEVTLRDGRPVIPVMASNKRKLGGLIHDESATGKTVYIEPAAVVELSNELRELEYAERREIVKILIAFADQVRPYIDDLLEAYLFLGKIDFLRSKARLAIRLGGILPLLQKEHQMNWRNAIHPLLYLAHKAEGKSVVPLNLALDVTKRILIISGPNAGGKSVCLKTTGLLQYMLQCGLLVPMGENSEVCLFGKIFIDIGDQQSLENDLSTYSGHLMNMKHFLRHASNETLILIDEFGSGTEPALGAAIAESILEQLNTIKVFGVITTHYANLKHFAAENEGIINGAMLFDTQKIEPLFSLAIGRPGNSFAIDIARKIGLPEPILKNASEKIGEDYINFEKHLREIIRDKKYWEEKRSRIRNVEKTLDSLYANYSNELEDIQKERKKIIQQAKAEAQALLKDANKQIEGTIREIRENHADKEKTRETRAKLEAFREDLEKEKPGTENYQKKLNELHKAGKKLVERSPDLTESKIAFKEKKDVQAKEEFEIGDTVRMKGFDTLGEILDITDKSILVAFGGMITTVDKSKLETGKKEKKSENKTSRSSSSTNLSERKLNFKPDIDVRGMRGEEALVKVQEFVDDALMVSVRHLRILHGKGNGILRQMIREYLSSMGIIKSLKDEHADRGGSGITLVDLDF